MRLYSHFVLMLCVVFALNVRADEPMHPILTISGSGSGGVPGWPYFVLTATNLSLPLSGWTPMATNYFDPAGNFRFTNVPLSPAAARFYLLKLQ